VCVALTCSPLSPRPTDLSPPSHARRPPSPTRSSTCTTRRATSSTAAPRSHRPPAERPSCGARAARAGGSRGRTRSPACPRRPRRERRVGRSPRSLDGARATSSWSVYGRAGLSLFLSAGRRCGSAMSDGFSSSQSEPVLSVVEESRRARERELARLGDERERVREQGEGPTALEIQLQGVYAVAANKQKLGKIVETVGEERKAGTAGRRAREVDLEESVLVVESRHRATPRTFSSPHLVRLEPTLEEPARITVKQNERKLLEHLALADRTLAPAARSLPAPDPRTLAEALRTKL